MLFTTAGDRLETEQGDILAELAGDPVELCSVCAGSAWDVPAGCMDLSFHVGTCTGCGAVGVTVYPDPAMGA